MKALYALCRHVHHVRNVRARIVPGVDSCGRDPVRPEVETTRKYVCGEWNFHSRPFLEVPAAHRTVLYWMNLLRDHRLSKMSECSRVDLSSGGLTSVKWEGL